MNASTASCGESCRQSRSLSITLTIFLGSAIPGGLWKDLKCVSLTIESRWTAEKFRRAQEEDKELRPLKAALAGDDYSTPKELKERYLLPGIASYSGIG